VSDVLWVLSQIEWVDIVDILLVAIAFYLLFSLAQGTQAVQLLRGMILVILVAFVLSQILPFKGFSWLIENAFPALLIAIPVIFQPELRRALERLGRTGSLPSCCAPSFIQTQPCMTRQSSSVMVESWRPNACCPPHRTRSMAGLALAIGRRSA
jgi:DNA integrity scanning protein DisA with diadenylate cyclase activity